MRAEDIITVGEMPEVASAKSTPSPATEFNAIDELKKRAAKIQLNAYGRISESIVRTTSLESNRWFLGNELRSAPIAETRFYACKRVIKYITDT